MGGDLNLKKSWHPHLRKNQERVWKEEKSALEERKQIEKLRKEREEERALEELQKLQESAGGRTVQRRVDWMYSGPGGDGAGVTEEREGYLLGKRRIDQLLKNDTTDLQKGAAVGIDALGNANANSARDTQKKVLEDPLLMIQKQKMELQLKAMKDAQKQAKYEEKRTKEKERSERRHRDRDDRPRDREDRHRDRGDRHGDRGDRHRDRSDRHRDRGERHGERGDRHRDHGDRHRDRGDSYRDRNHRDDYRRRSRSPYRGDRSREDRSCRERSPDTRSREDTRPARDSRPTPNTKPSSADDDRAERLAKMQADATSTEASRAERVREQGIKDAEEEARIQKNLNSSRRLNAGMGAVDAGGVGDALSRGRLRAEVDA